MTPRNKTLELSSVRIASKTAIYQITHEGEELWALIWHGGGDANPNIWNFSSQEVFCCEGMESTGGWTR